MKICFVTSTIFNLGGVQRVLSVIASELSKQHEVTVLCTDDNYSIDRTLYNLSKEVRITINSDLMSKGLLTKITRKVLKIINKYTGILNKKKFTNVLLDSYYPVEVRKKFIDYFNNKNYDFVIGVEGFYSVLIGAISKDINSRTLGWQHNCYDAYFNNKNRYYWRQDVIFERYLGDLEHYIVLNEIDANRFMIEKNLKCEVIYNPRSFTSDEKSNLKSKQMLAAGRFNYQKGFDLLIESFSKFAQSNKEWNLVIVGDGEERKSILNLIDKYNLKDRIRVDRFTNDIKEYFKNSSVLLLPSRWEGMPMIVLESLEMGVPIISYDISAVQPMIDNNIQGIVVEKYDIEQYVQAMKKLSNSYDLRRKMGQNSIIKSNNFSIENIISKWNKLLINL